MEACKERKVDRTKHFISMKQVKFQVEEEEGQSTHEIRHGTQNKWLHEGISAAAGGVIRIFERPPKGKGHAKQTPQGGSVREKWATFTNSCPDPPSVCGDPSLGAGILKLLSWLPGGILSKSGSGNIGIFQQGVSLDRWKKIGFVVPF